MPYSGAMSLYGTMGRAEAAYFRMRNERGGINGRKIVFLSLDDAYSPPKTVEQTRRLVEQDQVLLIFSTFGTATNAAVQKYLKIFRVSLTARLHYRGDFFLGTVLRYLPMVTTLLLWQAVYGDSDPNRTIADYTRNQMIAYLLLVHISRMFSSMPGLAYGIARELRLSRGRALLIGLAPGEHEPALGGQS